MTSQQLRDVSIASVEVNAPSLDVVPRAAAELLNSVEGQSRRLAPRGMIELAKHAIAVMQAGSPAVSKADAMSFALQRQRFLRDYAVHVIHSGQVSFTIPADKGFADLMAEAQALSWGVRRGLLRSPEVAELESLVPRDSTGPGAQRYCIDGDVVGSTSMTRSEQESRGWNKVEGRTLAAAHQAYLIATGMDLFGGKSVRARSCTLYFRHGRLQRDIGDDGFRFKTIAASRSLEGKDGSPGGITSGK